MEGTLYPTTLSGLEIRLLTVLPGEPSDSLSCSLDRVALDDCPPYEALSYCWGDPKLERIPITCNGQSISVTPSLRNALKQMRQTDVPRMVWADALCINQDNSDEKNTQIPLMRKVYSSAEQVITYLGNAPADEARAVSKFLQGLSEMVEAHPVTSSSEIVQANVPEVQNWVKEELKSRELVSSFEKFVSNEYFGRVWCVQEVKLAQNVIVLYGPEEIPGKYIPTTLNWLFDFDFRQNPHLPALIEPVYQNAMAMFTPIPTMSLMITISSFDTFKATNARDKVYGILGLADPSEADAIPVDYHKSVADVYADTVLAYAKLTGSLSFLHEVHHREDYDGNDGFKTWVPRWDDSLGNPAEFKTSPLQGAQEGVFPPLIASVDDGNLNLRGFLYSTVVSVTETMEYEDFEPPRATGTANYILQLWHQAFPPTMTPGTDITAALYKMARTLTTAMCFKEEVSSWVKGLDATSDDRGQHLYDFLAYMKHLYAVLPAAKHVPSQPPQIPEGLGDRKRYVDYSSRACHNRRVFWTENGVYGLGPPNMRQGDVVVILGGGDVPYVLRSRKDREEYLYVGNAYVDDIMMGLAKEGMRDGKYEEKEFLLV